MSNAPIPTQSGDTPTKVVLLGLAGDNDKALVLYNQIAGEVSAFLGKARQNRTISESPSQYMQQARPGGGSFRYQYNNGLETVFVTLTTSETHFATTPEPVEPPPSIPQLAIDVVFEPERFAAEDIYHIQQIVEPAQGGKPGDYRTWDKDHIGPSPRSTILSYYPRSGYGYAIHRPGGGDDDYDYYYDGREELAGGGGDMVLYGNNPSIGAVVYNAVRGGASYYTTEIELEKAGLGGATEQTYAGPGGGGTDDFGLASLKAVISASSADAATATWAIVYMPVETNFVYPHGTPVGDYFTNLKSLPPVEFYYRPDGFRDVNAEDKVERFDVRNMVAVVADPDGKDPYRVSSPGMETEPPNDERLKFLRYDEAEFKVTRELDIHDDRGDPGTFGAGFLADMKEPTSARYGESMTFHIYVASVNSTAHNAPPGPKKSLDRESPEVTRDIDAVLRLRIRAREFNGVKPKKAGVQSQINFRTTTVDDDGTKVEYSDEATAPTGGGELGPIGGGTPPPEYVEWAFAVGPNWVDAGGEPSDPDAKDMGALLADSMGKMPTVAGPDDKATRYYTETEWDHEIEHMTKVAELTWKPPKSIGESGSATLKMLV